MTEPTARLRDLLRELVDAEIRFVLVGGLAVNAWGYLRGTQDIDLVPDPDADNLSRLAALLVDLGGTVEVGGQLLSAESISIFLRAGDLTMIQTPLGKVDVLQGLPTIPRYSELIKGAEAVELGEITVRVCSLHDLLEMKRAAGRPLDLIDIEALEAAHPGLSETGDEGR